MAIEKLITFVVVLVCGSFANALTDGSVYFYTNINFTGTLFPVDISQPNRCYNLCDFNDASSVQWIGKYPKTGDTYGKSHIAFYTEKTCFGPHVHFPIQFKMYRRGGNILVNSSLHDLRRYAINDDVSSFMIWETSENIENGSQTHCPWKA